jgi:hypothetical protein
VDAEFKICSGHHSSTYLVMMTGDLTSFDAYKAPLRHDMTSSLQKMFHFSPCPCPGARFGDRVKPDQLKMDVHRFLEMGARFLALPKALTPTVAIFEKFRYFKYLFGQSSFHVSIALQRVPLRLKLFATRPVLITPTRHCFYASHKA